MRSMICVANSKQISIRPGADVKQHIAGSGDGMAVARPEFPEGMQFGGPRIAEEPVPGIRSEGSDTSESGVDVAEFHRANQPGEVAAERAHGSVAFRFRLHRDNKEDCCAGEWREHWLRKRSLVWLIERPHPTCLALLRFGFILSFLANPTFILWMPRRRKRLLPWYETADHRVPMKCFFQNLRYHRQAILRKK